MIKDLLKKLTDTGFKVDNHSGVMDGQPIYIIDVYGHKKQKGQVRLVSGDWFNFRESAEVLIDKIKKTRGKIAL